MLACLITILLAAMALGVPIFISMSLSTITAMLAFGNYDIVIAMQRLFDGMDKFSLMSMPFYILAADIMIVGGLSKRILDFADVFIGGFHGSLALTTEASSMFFGALSGSSPATVSAIGTMMYPQLVKSGYGPKFSTGLITSAGSVAILIPPSITFIVYGAVTGVSIGALFMAGFGAGLVYGAGVLLYSYWYARKNNIPLSKSATWDEKWKATKDASWALGVPIIIMGGIMSGMFTPTEAAGVSVVYAAFVTSVVYKELTFKGLIKALLRSSVTISQLMILLGAAALFGWAFTVTYVPQMFMAHLVEVVNSPYVFLLILNIVFLILGMFIDGSAAITIMAPLFYRPALSMGIDPVHLGAVAVSNFAIGMFTPPFGLNLFVSKTISDLKMSGIYSAVLPFIIINIITLLLITYIPDISLLIPKLTGYVGSQSVLGTM